MKMIGSIRVNIVGHHDPMLSIADMDNNVAIELFGPEIEELREWLNSQISPTEAESYFKLGPEEWAEIRGEPFEDADELEVPIHPTKLGGATYLTPEELKAIDNGAPFVVSLDDLTVIPPDKLKELGIPFEDEDDVADEMNPTRYPYQEG